MPQVKEMGAVLMAVNNLAEQCYLPAYGSLEKMNMLTKMDMVKVIAKQKGLILAVISISF